MIPYYTISSKSLVEFLQLFRFFQGFLSKIPERHMPGIIQLNDYVNVHVNHAKYYPEFTGP